MLHLRYFDEDKYADCDTLSFKNPNFEYVVKIKFLSWINEDHIKIGAKMIANNRKLVLTSYDVKLYVLNEETLQQDEIIDVESLKSDQLTEFNKYEWEEFFAIVIFSLEFHDFFT